MVREDLVPESVLFALFPDPYRVVTESINFIEETDDQPFLLQASIPGPHDLEQVPAPYRNMFPPESAPVRSAGDELNKVTQSGNQKMVRMEDWKLVYDMIGYGQLYNLRSDPFELKNLFSMPDHSVIQSRLMA